MKHVFLSALLLLLAGGYAQAQQLIYRPVNPSFGGNTFNYQWMLSSAQAQDRNVDPAARRNQTTLGTQQRNSLNDFSESIQRQLLNRITRDLVDRQFGETALQEGTYTFGDFQVDIRNAADGIIVRIVDGQGGETTITVPYF